MVKLSSEQNPCYSELYLGQTLFMVNSCYDEILISLGWRKLWLSLVDVKTTECQSDGLTTWIIGIPTVQEGYVNRNNITDKLLLTLFPFRHHQDKNIHTILPADRPRVVH